MEMMTAIAGKTCQGRDRFISHSLGQVSIPMQWGFVHSAISRDLILDSKGKYSRRNRRKWRPGLGKWITKLRWYMLTSHRQRALGDKINLWIFGLASFFLSREQESDKKLENVSVLLSLSHTLRVPTWGALCSETVQIWQTCIGESKEMLPSTTV